MNPANNTVNHISQRVRWVSLADVADIYGISERSCRRLIAEGELPAYRIGKRAVRVKASDLDDLARPIPCPAS